MDALEADLENEEEVEKPDPALKAPDLYVCAKENQTDEVLAMLEEGVPPFYFDKKTEWTALHWASVHGNAKVVKKLLEAGAHRKYHNQIAREERLAKHDGQDIASIMKELSIEEQTILQEQIEADKEDMESKINYLENTPLLWAALKGHMEVVWQLLKVGYSPNDTDKLGNTALHLAAASGFKKIVQTLIDDGAMPTVVNIYKNPPGYLAKDKDISDLLVVAVEKDASMTAEDIKRKHEDNMKKLAKMELDLSNVVSDAQKAENPRSVKGVVNINITELIPRLSNTLQLSEEWCLNKELCAQGRELLMKLETAMDLLSDLSALQKRMPIKCQAEYLEYASKLEGALERAEKSGLEKGHLKMGADLLQKCQNEIALCSYINRLKNVTCAVDANEHDMKRLIAATEKAVSKECSEEIIQQASKLSLRLEAELGMTRALKSIPTVKLPPLPVKSKEHPEGLVPEVPEGYWQPSDLGHIEETEEYPKPPAEIDGEPNTGGEYIWVPSESFTKLRRAIDLMKECIAKAGVDSGANEELLQTTKDSLTKAEKDYKQLDGKNEHDKASGIDVAVKAAKKLKKGKGGKKK